MSQSGEKTDLRVYRTQQALQTALLLLLEKMPFSKITVQTICQKAGVSRATFYMHYQDKYALLRVCLEQLWEQANGQPEHSHEEIIRRVVYLTYANAKLFKNILNSGSDQELTRMLSQAMVTEFMEKLKGLKAAVQYPVPEEILARFISGGMAHLLIWWMMDNCSIPPEEMAERLLALAEHLYPQNERPLEHAE